MLSATKHSLKKVETLAAELGYTVRYEKGNFQSGYCLVESRKIVVVNRFFDTEGRLNVLYDVLSTFRPDEDLPELSNPSRKLWKKLQPFLGLRGPAAEEE